MAQLDKKTYSIGTWNGGVISEYAQCILAPNATPLTGKGTNTWIVARPTDEACVVIDPGPKNAEHQRAIRAACTVANKKVAAVLLTHNHKDHAGCAQEFAEAVDAPVFSRAARNLTDGFLKLDGVTAELEVVSLPGHSSDSVGFLLHDDRSLFTGDVIFSGTPTLVCWPDGSLAQYLDTLNHLSDISMRYSITCFYAAHGIPIQEPLERIAQCRRHRYKRLHQVVSTVKSGVPAQAEKLAEVIYNDINPKLFQAAVRSVNAQLRYAFDTGLLQEPKPRN